MGGGGRGCRQEAERVNILIEIGHPAHVHCFKDVIEALIASGNHVVLVTRNKEITNRLLDILGLPYQCLTSPARSKAGMCLELIYRWWKIWRIIGYEHIDASVSISGISTALPSWLRGIPNLILTDTEDATLSNKLAFPFANHILTPDFFLHDLGHRHIRYKGLHELAYLNNRDLTDRQARLTSLGLNRPYSIIRLIAYDAAHDWYLSHSSEAEICKMVKLLEQHGDVFITSQKTIPDSIKHLELRFPIECIHDVLAGARFFVGESPTMAVEAGLLGTPSVLISSRSPYLGNMIHLESMGLLANVQGWDQACILLQTWARKSGFREEWAIRACKFREEATDLTSLVTDVLKRLVLGQGL